MSDPLTRLFTFVCPVLGVITSTLMFGAPLLDVTKAAQNGRLGELNPTPWAIMFGTSLGWTYYGLWIRDYYIIAANIPGFFLSVWFNLQAVKLIYGDYRCNKERALILHKLTTEISKSEKFSRRFTLLNKYKATMEQGQCEESESAVTLSPPRDYAKIVSEVATQSRQAPVTHEKLIVFIAIVWVVVASIISFGLSLSQLTRELIVGVVINCSLIFFYAASSSTILQVLRSRSSKALHVSTMLLCTCNGALWLVYGVFIQNYYIGFPNIVGAILGTIQICLYIVFPRQSTSCYSIESVNNRMDRINATVHSSTVPESGNDTENVDDLAVKTSTTRNYSSYFFDCDLASDKLNTTNHSSNFFDCDNSISLRSEDEILFEYADDIENKCRDADDIDNNCQDVDDIENNCRKANRDADDIKNQDRDANDIKDQGRDAGNVEKKCRYANDIENNCREDEDVEKKRRVPTNKLRNKRLLLLHEFRGESISDINVDCLTLEFGR